MVKNISLEAMSAALYEQDFYLWTQATAQVLKNHQWEELDLQNLIEEVESMGRAEKNALKSNLIVVLLHLLKYAYQPERRSDSWTNSVTEHRIRIEVEIESNPSLKPYIQEVYDSCYAKARRLAANDETNLPLVAFPIESPWTSEQSLDSTFLPEIEQHT